MSLRLNFRGSAEQEVSTERSEGDVGWEQEGEATWLENAPGVSRAHVVRAGPGSSGTGPLPQPGVSLTLLDRSSPGS